MMQIMAGTPQMKLFTTLLILAIFSDIFPLFPRKFFKTTT